MSGIQKYDIYKRCDSRALTNNLFCREFGRMEYEECMILAGYWYLICLGEIFLRYPFYSITTLACAAGRDRWDSSYSYRFDANTATVAGGKRTMLTYGEFRNRLLIEENIGGWTFLEFNCWNVLMSIFYFAAKVFLFLDSSQYIEDNNQIFERVNFKNYSDANAFLVMFIFTHTLFPSFHQLYCFNQYKILHNNEVSYFLIILQLFYVIDIVTSFVFMFIMYGIFTFYLYYVTIAILVCVMLLVTIICWFPCFGGCGYICIFLSVEFSKEKLGGFKKRCGRLLVQAVGGFTMHLMLYFVQALIITFCWLCNTKESGEGLPKSIVFVKDTTNHVLIGTMLIVAASIGFLGGALGICTCMCRHDDDKR